MPRKSKKTREVHYESRYVYCIIEGGEKQNFGKIGIDGTTVYTIPYNNISAVVSDTPLREYEPSEANAMAHEKVVEHVMQKHTVLPLGFGNIFINENRVKWLLTRFYRTSRIYLKKLDGKVEMGVKVFYDLETARRDIENTNDEIKKLKEAMASARLKQNQFSREKLVTATTRKFAEEVSKKAYEYGVRIYEALGKVAVDSRLMKRISDDMIMNGTFLVNKDKMAQFEKTLETLNKEYEKQGLKFQHSGPWPPYNFAHIRIGNT